MSNREREKRGKSEGAGPLGRLRHGPVRGRAEGERVARLDWARGERSRPSAQGSRSAELKERREIERVAFPFSFLFSHFKTNFKYKPNS